MERKKPSVDRTKAWDHIKGNITCMRTQPQNGK